MDYINIVATPEIMFWVSIFSLAWLMVGVILGRMMRSGGGRSHHGHGRGGRNRGNGGGDDAPARDRDDGNGLILRLYEPNGARGPVTVTLTLPVKSAVECNHVEEGNLPADFKNGKLNLTLTPYQIRTFRLL